MSVSITPYDPVTGKFQGYVSTCDQGLLMYEEMGYVWVDGIHNGDTHYILDGEVTERPASPVTRTDLTLLDVPEGSTLWINGESYGAAGTVELEFPLPGTYSLRVECFPYLNWTDEVTV